MSIFSNIASGALDNVSMYIKKAGTYQLYRAVTADTEELARYGNCTGHHTALAMRRIGWSLASCASISNAVSAYQHHRALEELKAAKEKRTEISQLITDRIEDSEKNYGWVDLEGFKAIAKDINGNKVPEALILYYKGEQDITVRTDTINGNGPDSMDVTKYVYFIDTAPEISFSTKKNLVMTPVQGRDFTRKELVSGGDMMFSVSGNVVSHIQGMYPENEMRKLINIAEHGGIIGANNLILGQFNVDHVIITDFHLEKQQFKNIQPYSMSIVAVEPDTDVVVESDTIDLINYSIQRQNRDTMDDIALALNEAGRLTGIDYSLADLIQSIGGGTI